MLLLKRSLPHLLQMATLWFLKSKMMMMMIDEYQKECITYSSHNFSDINLLPDEEAPIHTTEEPDYIQV